MSTEENKAIVRRYLGALSGKEKPATLVREFVADSDEALRQHITAMEAAFPRYELIAEDMIAEGDKVVVRATVRGTHRGELMGIPPTGKEVSAGGILIYRITGAKIVEHWMQFDDLGTLQQLGAIPTPGQPAS